MAIAVNVTYVVHAYLEGLTSEMAADELLSSPIFRFDENTFIATGPTVAIANVEAPAAAPEKTYGAGTGSDAAALVASTVNANVYTMTPAHKVTYTDQQRYNRNVAPVVGSPGSIEELLVRNFKNAGRQRLAIRAMTNMAAASGILLTDVSGETAPDDKITYENSLDLVQRFGDNQRNIANWVMHSGAVAQILKLKNSYNQFYFQRNEKGELYVHGYKVIECDIGTKSADATPIYSSFLCRSESAAIGTDTPLDIQEIPVADSAAGGEGGTTYQVPTNYYVHFFAKRPDTDRSGVAVLKHH